MRFRLSEYISPNQLSVSSATLERIRRIRSVDCLVGGHADGAALWVVEVEYSCCEFAMKSEMENSAMPASPIAGRLKLTPSPTKDASNV